MIPRVPARLFARASVASGVEVVMLELRSTEDLATSGTDDCAPTIAFMRNGEYPPGGVVVKRRRLHCRRQRRGALPLPGARCSLVAPKAAIEALVRAIAKEEGRFGVRVPRRRGASACARTRLSARCQIDHLNVLDLAVRAEGEGVLRLGQRCTGLRRVEIRRPRRPHGARGGLSFRRRGDRREGISCRSCPSSQGMTR